MSTDFGLISIELDGLQPEFGQISLALANFGGHIRPKQTKSGARCTEFGQMWQGFGQIWPKCPECVPISAPLQF